MQGAEDVIGIVRMNDKLQGRGRAPRRRGDKEPNVFVKIWRAIRPSGPIQGATNERHVARLRRNQPTREEAITAARLRDRGKFHTS